jgi:SAM-dependent methyltransferase
LPGPEELRECRRGAEWAAVAAAAVQVGLFEALAESPASANELARRLGLDARALGIVVEALLALGLVAREGSELRLGEEARARFVDQSSGVYEAGAVKRWLKTMRRWVRLDEALRAGGPLREDGDGAERVASFQAAMATKPPDQVRHVVASCLRRRPRATSVLDLGGGPGVHSRAFAARGLRVTLFDTPETIEHVGEAYELREAGGIELVAGDFLESLPAGRYDIVLLSNITHIYDADTNRDLLSRVASLQAPGDLLAIMDFVRGVSEFAPLFAITMLLATDSGNTYHLDMYRQWLTAASYEEMEVEDIDADRQLITALRAGYATDELGNQLSVIGDR